MLLINCKVEIFLRWIEECVLTTAEIGAGANATTADSATFKITDSKLYFPFVRYFFDREQCKITKTIRRKI